MSEALGITSIALIIATVILFVLLARTTYEYKRQVRRAARHLDHEAAKLETQIDSLERDFEKLLKEANNKIDKEYLEKRVRGLSELLKQ